MADLRGLIRHLPAAPVLNTVSCPSALICYAGGTSGIMKSGRRWVNVGHATIPVSPRCLDLLLSAKIMHRRRSTRSLQTINGDDLERAASLPNGLSSRQHLMSNCEHLRSGRSIDGRTGHRRHTRRNSTWTTLDQPTVDSLSSMACSALLISAAVAIGLSQDGATSEQLRDAAFLVAPTSSIPAGSGLGAVSFAKVKPPVSRLGLNSQLDSYVIGTSNNGSTWTLQSPPPTAVELSGISCSALVTASPSAIAENLERARRSFQQRPEVFLGRFKANQLASAP